jgi:hypothetical protein
MYSTEKLDNKLIRLIEGRGMIIISDIKEFLIRPI